MDRKKYIVEASDDVKKVIAIGVTRGGAIWTDTTDIENLEELNSDYINEHYGSLQDDAYQRGHKEGYAKGFEEGTFAVSGDYQKGLDDAWEAARRISILESDGGYSWKEMKSIFGTDSASEIYVLHTATEAINKIKAYEEKQKADDEIKVGDEVIYIEHKFIVFATETEEHYASLFDVNGRHASASQSKCKKTGRHFDIPKILEEMKA